ncbi:hypothetical protein [Paludibacterium sp. B53371]|uniref:hypothetical protein n=1 Tax=Paludibacterium sp. B53371 TaxID=2806263 RepID=UPI001C047B84|nr:hypothetical protein [Paludibacterium sp. B53371]
MSLLSLSTLFLVMVAGFWLFAMWRVVASDHGVAQACFVAGYFPLAIVVRLGRTFDAMAPVWAPFLYPYAWVGLAAVFWAASQIRLTRHGLLIRETPRRMGALYLAALLLHLGVLLAMPLSQGRILSLYLMVPPAMVLLTMLLYFPLCWLMGRQAEGRIGWLPLVLLTLLVPLGWFKLCALTVPALLNYG